MNERHHGRFSDAAQWPVFAGPALVDRSIRLQLEVQANADGPVFRSPKPVQNEPDTFRQTEFHISP